MIHDSDQDTETPTQSLTVAAYGWKHPTWQPDFYPDDMPEDWQLTYYANEFAGVVVPQGYLAECNFNVESWLEDVADDFEFYLEYPNAHEAQKLFPAVCEQLMNNLAGIISYQMIPGNLSVPIYSFHPDAPAEQKIWTPDDQTVSGVAHFSLSDFHVRTWRQWLEQFVESCDGNLNAVFVSDDIIDIKKLQELKTLVELMGL